MNQGHVQSGEIIDLELLKEDMDVDASYALIKTEDMEVIRMALPAGKKIEEHSVAGEMSVQCLKGNIQFRLEEGNRSLSADDWMFLERKQPFSYTVNKDTILLVTILFTKKTEKDS